MTIKHTSMLFPKNQIIQSPQHAPCNGDSIGNMWCVNKEGERITDVRIMMVIGDGFGDGDGDGLLSRLIHDAASWL